MKIWTKYVGWLFTLKGKTRLPGKEIFHTGDFTQTDKLLEIINHQNVGLEAKDEKSKATKFS